MPTVTPLAWVRRRFSWSAVPTLARLAYAFALAPTGAALTAALAAGLPAAPFPHSQDSVWSGVYTEEQAKRGEQLYKTTCSYCHRDDLTGGFFDDGTGRAPALAGSRAFDSSFSERWGDLTLAEMLATIATSMPQQRPASLSIQAYVDILSYLLMKNEIPAGERELPTDVERLQQIVITPKP